MKLVIAGNAGQFRRFLQQYNIAPEDRREYIYIDKEEKFLGCHAANNEIILTGTFWETNTYGSASYEMLKQEGIKISEKPY